jgi:hypothetical protein
LTAGLNIGVTLADIVVHSVHGPGEDLLLGYIIMSAYMLLLTVILTWSFESMMISEVEALLEAKQSNRSSSLVRRLLSAMCDCIVHLDSHLVIVESCPKLASLLLRSPTSPVLAQPFAQLMPPSERERFIQYLRGEESLQGSSLGNASVDSPVLALHLNLVDARGLLFPIEMFSSFVRDSDGTVFHLVGIKEDVDPQRQRGIGE